MPLSKLGCKNVVMPLKKKNTILPQWLDCWKRREVKRSYPVSLYLPHVYLKLLSTIFLLITTYQMTMWKQCDNMEGIACSDETTENYHLNHLSQCCFSRSSNCFSPPSDKTHRSASRNSAPMVASVPDLRCYGFTDVVKLMEQSQLGYGKDSGEGIDKCFLEVRGPLSSWLQ